MTETKNPTRKLFDEARARAVESGLKGEQVSRALSILRRGSTLVTWTCPTDQKTRFMELRKRKGKS